MDKCEELVKKHEIEKIHEPTYITRRLDLVSMRKNESQIEWINRDPKIEMQDNCIVCSVELQDADEVVHVHCGNNVTHPVHWKCMIVKWGDMKDCCPRCSSK